MNGINAAQPTPAHPESEEHEKEQEMERVQEEAAKDQATEGGYQ
jgi:hypothetical protein